MSGNGFGLLDGFEGKLTTSIDAKLAKCSGDTALRDIGALVERGILVQNEGGGRSTSLANSSTSADESERSMDALNIGSRTGTTTACWQAAEVQSLAQIRQERQERGWREPSTAGDRA